MVPLCTPVRARVAGVGRPTEEEESSRGRLQIYDLWMNERNMRLGITEPETVTA